MPHKDGSPPSQDFETGTPGRPFPRHQPPVRRRRPLVLAEKAAAKPLVGASRETQQRQPPVRRTEWLKPEPTGPVPPSRRGKAWVRIISYAVLIVALLAAFWLYRPLYLPNPVPNASEPQTQRDPAEDLRAPFRQALAMDNPSGARFLLSQMTEVGAETSEETAALEQWDRTNREALSTAFGDAEIAGDIEAMIKARDRYAVFWPEDPLREDWSSRIEKLRETRDTAERVRDLWAQYKQAAARGELYRAGAILDQLAALGENVSTEKRKYLRAVSLPGGVSLRMRWIPAGSFTMGSPDKEQERREDELAHRVTLTRGFWMGESEVTQAQWNALMSLNPSQFMGKDKPVQNISWEDVQVFIFKLNEHEGTEKYRIPTEAEWEYACRAGTVTPFAFGERLSTDQANYDGNYPYRDGPKGDYRQEPLGVGSFRPNAWGLYDMHGNVWEWCSDRYGPYSPTPTIDPRGSVMFRDPYYVLRGGGWGDFAATCRCASRFKQRSDGRGGNIGFRIARSE